VLLKEGMKRLTGSGIRIVSLISQGTDHGCSPLYRTNGKYQEGCPDGTITLVKDEILPEESHV
jgi:hypothetical protein